MRGLSVGQTLLASALYSESKPQRTLHHARRTRRNHLPESRIHLVAGRIELGRSIQGRILGVIERVISFPSQLEVALFTLHRETFGECQIEVIDAWVANANLPRIAGVAFSRPGEGRGIEPVEERRRNRICV